MVRPTPKLGEHKKALARFDAAISADQSHYLSDDALFRGALQAAEIGDRAGFKRRLRRLVKEHRRGDMRGRALFRLARDARAHGELADAIRYLDRALAEGAGEGREGMRGRAAYWRARSLFDQGQQARAYDAWAELARDYPLNYHAMLALGRLAQARPDQYAEVLAQWRAPNPQQLPAETRARSGAKFARAEALLTVGEDKLAERELRAAGVYGEGASHGLLWAAAELCDRYGGL